MLTPITASAGSSAAIRTTTVPAVPTTKGCVTAPLTVRVPSNVSVTAVGGGPVGPLGVELSLQALTASAATSRAGTQRARTERSRDPGRTG